MLFSVTERAKSAIKIYRTKIGGDVVPVITWAKTESELGGMWIFGGFSEKQPRNEPFRTTVYGVEFIVDGPMNRLSTLANMTLDYDATFEFYQDQRDQSEG